MSGTQNIIEKMIDSNGMEFQTDAEQMQKNYDLFEEVREYSKTQKRKIILPKELREQDTEIRGRLIEIVDLFQKYETVENLDSKSKESMKAQEQILLDLQNDIFEEINSIVEYWS